MPINIINTIVVDGPETIPGWAYIKSYGPIIASIAALKWYFRGTQNTWERDLHGKVYIITGGTSGMGASIVDDLASKGAQLILLVRSIDDYWTQDYVSELREKHQNFLIYAEECDLSSLYSIRKFATKWLDNLPPRRLDGVICCAAESLPAYKERENSIDGIELQTAVNYVGHYHLLTLLSPSLRSQLPDRDVRVILTTCMSQALGDVGLEDPLFLSKRYPKNKPWTVFGASKLKLSLFGKEFQRRLMAAPRKDGTSCNVRVNIVNPGLMRSPSTKRVLSFGSLFGLLIYVLLLPILWIFVKSTNNGAQSTFHTLMSPDFVGLDGGNFISNCVIYKPARKEFEDPELQKELYDKTEKEIERIEKESAIKRKKAEQLAEKFKKKNGKKEEKGPKDGSSSSGEVYTGSKISLDNTKEQLFPDFDDLKGKLNNDNGKKSAKSTTAGGKNLKRKGKKT